MEITVTREQKTWKTKEKWTESQGPVEECPMNPVPTGGGPEKKEWVARESIWVMVEFSNFDEKHEYNPQSLSNLKECKRKEDEVDTLKSNFHDTKTEDLWK